jgi:putative FmdB family regulatory protein
VPIYEYTCGKCHHDFEELVLDRAAVIHCPKCGGKKVKKRLSVFAHKSDAGFTPSSGGGSSCSGCSSSSCSGCGH